jgi:hypothetical protein
MASCVAKGSSTVVEHLANFRVIKGSNLAIYRSTPRQNIILKCILNIFFIRVSISNIRNILWLQWNDWQLVISGKSY